MLSQNETVCYKIIKGCHKKNTLKYISVFIGKYEFLI